MKNFTTENTEKLIVINNKNTEDTEEEKGDATEEHGNE